MFESIDLCVFIVRAESATWLARGPRSLPYRPGSHDLQYHEGDLAYLDSYFGSEDFLGQEVVYRCGEPVWVMNDHGRIVLPDLYEGARSAGVTVPRRSSLYAQGRFLGVHEHATADGIYFNEGGEDLAAFTGREWIVLGGDTVYEMRYHGGFVRP